MADADSTSVRVCTSCNAPKPLTEFWLRDKTSGRPHSQCIACMKEKRRTPDAVAKRRSSEKDRYARDPQRSRDKHTRWRQRYPEKHNAATKRWREMNPEKHKQFVRAWYQANIDKAREYRSSYYAANRDKYRTLIKAWTIANAERLKPVVAKYAADRRSKKLKATPSWANAAAVEALYVESKRLSDTTGIKHDVDHIVPLRSKFVCGLHVENNLRVIPAAVNRSKSNRHWPDMP